MLKLWLVVLCVSLFCLPSARADSSSRGASQKLNSSLHEIKHVEIYFLARTGTYSLSFDDFRRDATTRFYRKCGADCKNFMSAVVSHLEKSVAVVCRRGQQVALVDIGEKETLMYSYSGKIIEYDGQCYLNSVGIDKVIKTRHFMFE